MSIDDVQTINFADDEKAALAFISGEGEFYMGGLPSEINLLMNHPDQFKLIGGAEILGPAGLWYSNVASTEEVAGGKRGRRPQDHGHVVSLQPLRPGEDRRDHAHRRQGDERPFGRRDRRRQSLKFIFDKFLEFRTYKQDAETTYNPNSPAVLGELGEVLRRQVDRAAQGRRLCGQEPAERLVQEIRRQERPARLGRRASGRQARSSKGGALRLIGRPLRASPHRPPFQDACGQETAGDNPENNDIVRVRYTEGNHEPNGGVGRSDRARDGACTRDSADWSRRTSGR